LGAAAGALSQKRHAEPYGDARAPANQAVRCGAGATGREPLARRCCCSCSKTSIAPMCQASSWPATRRVAPPAAGDDGGHLPRVARARGLASPPPSIGGGVRARVHAARGGEPLVLTRPAPTRPRQPRPDLLSARRPRQCPRRARGDRAQPSASARSSFSIRAWRRSPARGSRASSSTCWPRRCPSRGAWDGSTRHGTPPRPSRPSPRSSPGRTCSRLSYRPAGSWASVRDLAEPRPASGPGVDLGLVPSVTASPPATRPKTT